MIKMDPSWTTLSSHPQTATTKHRHIVQGPVDSMTPYKHWNHWICVSTCTVTPESEGGTFMIGCWCLEGDNCCDSNSTNDARAEIDIIRTLAAHPLRTSDSKNASIFVIPISTAAHIIHDDKESIPEAIERLTETSVFRRTGGNRHLMVSLS